MKPKDKENGQDTNLENIWMKPNVLCWMDAGESEEFAFYKATILSTEKQDDKIRKVKIKYNDPAFEDKIEEVKPETILQRSEDKEETNEDLVNIDCLNDAELVYNIQNRFKNDCIYTYVGPTLLACNPYKPLPQIFDPNTLNEYQKQINNQTFTLKDLPPHVFAISAETYIQLTDNKKNQAIVISGESGAGKTETAKYAMKFLTSLGQIYDNVAGNLLSKGNEKKYSIKKTAIEEKILSCNPILEAFGNAKTLRNDNSSRFGKYVTLQVSMKNKKIISSRIDNYLLEKSRITTLGKDERNYHIFYHLLEGADFNMLDTLNLSNKGEKMQMVEFEYLKASGCYKVPNINDLELFGEVKRSFQSMEFNERDEKVVWSIVGSVLLLGNLQFDDKSLTDNTPCTVPNKDVLTSISKLLSVRDENLIKALVYKTRTIGKQVIESPLNKAECIFARDSLAKDLYEKLFNWLVHKLNLAISENEVTNEKQYWIGLLDIFGFEVFKKNSFEQFCINYTNEKLHQLYIAYVFKAEENVFVEEGLKQYICHLSFKDNKDVIDLMDKNITGIFNILDESCAVAGSDDSLVLKIRTAHRSHACFQIPKLNKEGFIIIHTAKDVEYTITGFRTKNKDEISQTCYDALSSSALKEIVDIFTASYAVQPQAEEKEKKQSKTKADKFLGAKFREQMRDLMQELQNCECHFIRCIKPNNIKERDLFVPRLALNQIQYLGVLQSIKVRKESYPHRKVYRVFFERYGEIADLKESFPKLDQRNADFKALTVSMFKTKIAEIKEDLVLFGNTKIFLRNKGLGLLEKKIEEKLRIKDLSARIIQRSFYRYKKMKQIRRIFKALKNLQTIFKVRMEYKWFQKQRRCVRKIQTWFRKKFYSKKTSNQRKQTIILQNYFRRYLAIKHYSDSWSSIIKCQKLIRGFIDRSKYKKYLFVKETVNTLIVDETWDIIINWKATQIQKLARGFLAKKKNFKNVLHIREYKKNYVENKAAVMIQKHLKGFRTRKLVRTMHKSAFKIQGFFKMKWLSIFFKNLRKATLTIQKSLKPFILKKTMVKKRLALYLGPMADEFDRKKFNEQIHFYPIKSNGLAKQGKEDATSRKKPEHDNIYKDLLKDSSPYSHKRMEVYSFIIDIEFMTDLWDYFGESWAESCSKLIQSSKAVENEVQMIEFGDSSSYLLTLNGRVYSWGSNDSGQLGSDTLSLEDICPEPKIIQGLEKVKCFSSGDAHIACIDQNGVTWVWGNNEKGQLGGSYIDSHKKWEGYKSTLENYKQDQSQSLDASFNLERLSDIKIKNCIPTPTKLVLPGQLLPKSLKCKGDQTYIIMENGALLTFDENKRLEENEDVLEPEDFTQPFVKIIDLGGREAVSAIACSHTFTLILTKSGLVFSMGTVNSEGELGVGDNKPRGEPTLLNNLANEKIVSIAAGYKHSLACSNKGSVYAWGWGGFGQLGLGDKKSHTTPHQIKFVDLEKSRHKVIQVEAGYRCSMALTNNNKILWWGTNSTLRLRCQPLELNLSEKSPTIAEKSSQFFPIKLMSSWTKTVSLFYITMLDSRNSDINQSLKQKTAATLQKKWFESNMQTVEPPFIDGLYQYFSNKYMKLSGRGKSQAGIHSHPDSSKLGSSNASFRNLTKMTEEDENRRDFSQELKTSFLEISSILCESRVEQRNLDYQQDQQIPISEGPLMTEQEQDKLKEIQAKYDKLVAVTREKWTPLDEQFMNLVQSPIMKKFLKLLE